MMRNWTFILTVAAAVAGVGAMSASATPVTFNFDIEPLLDSVRLWCSSHYIWHGDADSDGPADGTGTVNITVDLNNPPYVYAVTGAADFALFKFNATGVAGGHHRRSDRRR